MGNTCMKPKPMDRSSSRRLSITSQPEPVFNLPPNVGEDGDFVNGESKFVYSVVTVAGTYFQPSMNPFKGNTKYKTNQDSYFMSTKVQDKTSRQFFGVLDGHGSVGHDASRYAAKRLAELLPTMSSLESNPMDALTDVFVRVDKDMEASDIECNLSGTTCVVVYMDNTTLYIANAGDSRCVLGYYDGGQLKFKDLSNDHKPELPGEKARIESRGGRVAPLQSWPDGPHRVWLRDEDLPGLAMSRSLGDGVAHSVGVSPEPEILTHELSKENDAFLILASDGVWEFIESEEAVQMVATMPSPKSAANRLCSESVERWGKEEPVCDDITAMVIYINR